jgi:hypothetical protein
MLNNLTAEELEGGYRRLCGSLLIAAAYARAAPHRHRTAEALKRPFIVETMRQRATAVAWIDGGGRITFDEACDAIGVAPDRMRADMDRYCMPGARSGWRTKRR